MDAVRAIGRRLAEGLRSVDAGLLALREGMTPGQRWTAALAMSVTALVLLFGLPRHVIVVPGAEGATAAQLAFMRVTVSSFLKNCWLHMPIRSDAAAQLRTAFRGVGITKDLAPR